MQSLVGIIRTGPELEEALEKLGELRERADKVSVGGGRAYNPGWNLATDLPSMLTVSTAVAQGALDRKESRGGHTREDYPQRRPRAGQGQLRPAPDRATVVPDAPRSTSTPEPLPEMPAELRELLEEGTDARPARAIRTDDRPAGARDRASSDPTREAGDVTERWPRSIRR